MARSCGLRKRVCVTVNCIPWAYLETIESFPNVTEWHAYQYSACEVKSSVFKDVVDNMSISPTVVERRNSGPIAFRSI